MTPSDEPDTSDLIGQKVYFNGGYVGTIVNIRLSIQIQVNDQPNNLTWVRDIRNTNPPWEIRPTRRQK